jgi:hypothetical protein
MVFGPPEAFTPEHLAALYGINVLSTQRVNRVALPPTAQALEGSIIPVVEDMFQEGAAKHAMAPGTDPKLLATTAGLGYLRRRATVVLGSRPHSR